MLQMQRPEMPLHANMVTVLRVLLLALEAHHGFDFLNHFLGGAISSVEPDLSG
jgi:hypothetical protein